MDLLYALIAFVYCLVVLQFIRDAEAFLADLEESRRHYLEAAGL